MGVRLGVEGVERISCFPSNNLTEAVAEDLDKLTAGKHRRAGCARAS